MIKLHNKKLAKAITYYLRFIDKLYHVIENRFDLENSQDKAMAIQTYGGMEIQLLTYMEYRKSGFLYSIPFSSVSVFGKKRDPFENEIKKALVEVQPTGEFNENVTLEVISAWK